MYRSNDFTRLITVDPVGDHGMVFEVLTTPSQLTINMMPPAHGCNFDSPVVEVAYLTITNNGVAGVVSVGVEVDMALFITGPGITDGTF
jgi:hypothetical protein